MSTAEPVPHLPPEFAVEAEPFTDDDLARYFDADDGGDFRELLLGAQSGDLTAANELHDTAERVGGWRIEDDAAAEWALRKMAEAHDQLTALGAQYDAWRAPIDAWLERTTRQPTRTVRYFTEMLEDYAVRRREAGGGATLELPTGTLKASVSKPCADVADDAQVAMVIDLVLDDSRDHDELAQAWRKALADAGVEPDDLVKRTPKVYVGPLRKIVTLADVPDGWQITEMLSCGHTLVTYTTHPELDDDELPEPGEVRECAACEPDPIDGPARVAVASVTVTERTRPAVLGPDGIEVPGTTVKPGGISPKVVLGRA